MRISRPPDPLSLRGELGRKVIHAGTIAIPLLAWYLPREIVIGILLFGVTAALAVEWARSAVRVARYHFLIRTRWLLREHEREGISGATYMSIGYLLVFLLLPRPVAVVAMLYNALGDAVAAVVGKRWGRHRLRSGKSWEGAAAGLTANIAAGLLVPGIPVGAAVVGGCIATAIELLPLPINDNLTVTVGGGFALGAILALGVL